MSRRRRQTVSLSSIQLTAALVMDPFTERLLVSDGASTDILSCNVSVTPVQCSVIVDHTMLTGAPVDGGNTILLLLLLFLLLLLHLLLLLNLLLLLLLFLNPLLSSPTPPPVLIQPFFSSLPYV